MRLLVPVFVFSSVLLLLVAIRLLTKRETNISKFAGYWEGDNPQEQIPKKKKVKPYVLFATIGGSISGFLFFYIVTGNAKISIIGLLVGFAIPKMLTSSYEKRQRELMIRQLEQVTEVMASVLRSGGSIVDSLVRSASAVDNPMREELLITANEIRTGIPNAIAFENLADRVDYDDLRILSMGVKLQQEGMAVNLGFLLSKIQENIRYKNAFKRSVKVTTSENKTAGYVIALLPFGILAIMRVIQPVMVEKLYTTTVGLTIFGFSVVLIVIGLIWLNKIVEIRV